MTGLSASVPAGAEAQRNLCLGNIMKGLTPIVPGSSIGSIQIGMSEADAQSILSGPAKRVKDKKSGWVEYFYGEPPVPSALVFVDPSGHVAYAGSFAFGCQTPEGIRGMMSHDQQVREAYGIPSVLTDAGSDEFWLYNDRGLLSLV